MNMGIRLELKLDCRFRCFVCLEPINLRPMEKLPVDIPLAMEDLRAGKKPRTCCSCGSDHDFRRKRAAFRRYLQFLSMHVSEEMGAELEGMA